MSAAFTPADSMAAFTAALPNWVAETGARAPWNAPMGVRLAETMTTSWSDMGNLWKLRSGGSSPRAAGGCAFADEPVAVNNGWARLQPVVENCYERIRDFRAGHGLVFSVPVSDPVAGSRERECGHFRIA